MIDSLEPAISVALELLKNGKCNFIIILLLSFKYHLN